ncbi:hypothetical protein LOTGIDRAFT_129837 [Lottia gigantea]|uniref:Serpin domain-containing protein n=1 Tax=Lottia gigantea TaxID=225164 RepID=V3ZNZ4_LOTGI|nr:hypothetical protein LOTGIDRAFT_129837 [Lottia gigantea]ESO86042.1 hypothetical protein LOTGIDRAFT_129837 [Lottia gigantea]
MFDLSLPKFKLGSEVTLNSALQELGIKQLFGSADLSGITGQQGLNVDSVIQKAVLEVTEKGTKAAAVTGIAIVEMAFSLKTVTVNHPFMFVLRDMKTKTNLFLGRYTDPRST